MPPLFLLPGPPQIFIVGDHASRTSAVSGSKWSGIGNSSSGVVFHVEYGRWLLLWLEPLNDRDRDRESAALLELTGADFASLLVCAQSGAAAIKNIHLSWCIVLNASDPLSCVPEHFCALLYCGMTGRLKPQFSACQFSITCYTEWCNRMRWEMGC